MKKLYLLFVALLASFGIASAANWDIVFNVTGAEGLVATYQSTGEKINFQEGKNTIAIPEDDTNILFSLADPTQYKWVTFTDEVYGYNGLENISNNAIDWDIDEGAEYTIVIEKIQSENKGEEEVQGWNIVLNVTEGADRVKAVLGSSPTSSSATTIGLINGENNISIEYGKSLFITPQNSTDEVSFTKGNGDAINKTMFQNYYEIYASKTSQPANPYTLTVVDPNAKEEEEVQGWKVVINVEGAENITAGLTPGYFQTVNDITLSDGENTIIIPEDQYLSVAPKGDAKVTFTDNNGQSVAANMMDNKAFMLWANPKSEPANPYTLVAKDPAAERTQSVNVTIDEPSLVTIKVNGKNGVTAQEIKPTANTFEIPFNPETEQELAISHNKWSKIFDVIVDGKSAPKPEVSTYYIKLVNGEGDETTYVKNIDIKVNFPEDQKYTTTFTLDGPEEMISSIKVDDTEVEDIAASLEDGIETAPLSTIKITYNPEYIIESMTDNGVAPSTITSYYEISKIDRDHSINIKGKAPKTYDVVFNVTGAEGLVAKYRSSGETLELAEGKTTVSVSEKNNGLKFMVANGQYMFKTFSDNNGYSYPNDYTVQYDGSIWADVEEGDELTIVVEKIKRDNKLVLFYDDFSNLKADPMFFGPSFAKYTDLPNEIKPGYNIIDFREEDGSFSVNSVCNYNKLYPYKNGDIITIPYGAKFTDDKVANGDVYKIFFDNEPVKHTVTFEVEDGILDGYEVKKDILSDVDVTAPVEALGLTRFTIAPAAVSRAAAEGFNVKVGDEEIEPVNGVYTFETTADTKVVVKSAEEEIQGYQIILNVTGAERIKAYTGEKFSTDLPEKKLVDGKNTVTVPYEESLFIKAINPNDYVTFKDCDEDKVSISSEGYYELYEFLAKYSPYELTVIDGSIYRTKSVTITMDDPEKIVISRTDGTKFEPTEETIQILYNEENESRLTIGSRNNSVFYKVTADGKDIQDSYKTYYVNLVDKSGDEPVYVQNIDIKANFPEGLTFKTVINLDGPEEMISYIKINGVEVEDVKACLTEEGFEAAPLSKITIGIDSDYKVDALDDNGKTSYYVGTEYNISDLKQDHNITITGHKYAIYDVKFNVTGAEGFVASLGSTKLEFVDGENTKTFYEKNSYVYFDLVDANEWYFETFTDNDDTDYTAEARYGSVSIDIKEGKEFTIVAKKVERNNQIAVYLDDFDLSSLDYFACAFDNYDSPTYRMTNGYNLINFRDEDGMFKLFASVYSGQYSTLHAYKNDEKQELDGKYLEDENVAHNDVYKFFFDNDPGVHTVTFNLEDGVLDGYEVKKDIIADADATAPVKAVGPTRFSIAPATVSRAAAEGFTVKVAGQTIEPVDGVYTFTTTADTTVEIKAKSTTGIEDILMNANGPVDVFNLQGIRVLRDATADDIKALTPGFYIINGIKVLIK